MFSEEFVTAAHKHSSHHREEVESSKVCGCFYCLRNFPPAEVEEWIPEGSGTAHCPHCWIDAVIGSASGLPVSDPEFLKALHERWFERITYVEN
jgi:hypothetical protein